VVNYSFAETSSNTYLKLVRLPVWRNAI
jgi:hypothetical protein